MGPKPYGYERLCETVLLKLRFPDGCLLSFIPTWCYPLTYELHCFLHIHPDKLIGLVNTVYVNKLRNRQHLLSVVLHKASAVSQMKARACLMEVVPNLALSMF